MGSIWQKNADMPSFPVLEGAHRTDVLVIGGGMAGLLTAYMLKQKGVDCILLEKDRICEGTTSGTTAKITFQHGMIYHELLKKSGRENALIYLKANRTAFELMEKLCKNIDCDFEYKDSFVYSLDDREKAEKEVSALRSIGYEAELRESLNIPVDIAGAVMFPHQAQFQPLKFAAAIAERLPIYERSFVRELRGNTAVTERSTVTAKNIVIATHFPFLNKHGSYFLKLYQHRSYMLALENAPDVEGMYLDESGNGLSFRNYGKYLLLGGGSHRTGKKGGGWEELRSFGAKHYPHAREYCHWAAQDCMSLDNMPYIGQYSKSTTGLFTATGFNKWGMTGSALSALILTDMLTGRKNDFSELFSPSRNIMKPQLLINGFEATKNLLTISDKRCPHLGCALKWNKAEHSWDCPCHGSRFDENGRILNNPANGDLK